LAVEATALEILDEGVGREGRWCRNGGTNLWQDKRGKGRGGRENKSDVMEGSDE
jgi:hypothetical protein